MPTNDINAMTEKVCSICGKSVILDLFENDKRRPDGHGPRCKPCIKAKVQKVPGRKELAVENMLTHRQVFGDEKRDKYGSLRPGLDNCICGCAQGKHYLGRDNACANGCESDCRKFVLSEESKRLQLK